jgi:hypothetical protein
MDVEIVPTFMEKMTNYYNHAPHKTLSDLMGSPVTPDNAEHDIATNGNSERKIQIHNWLVRDDKAYNLKPGTLVRLYNFPHKDIKRRTDVSYDSYTVISRQGAFYVISNNRTKTEIKMNRPYICKI